MRKDEEAKNAQLQLEVAVRKAEVGAIVEAFKMAWDENLSWQDELTSQDISRILDAMDTYTDNSEIIRWGVCALQAIVAEEVKDSTSRQYSVQSIIRVGPFKIYDNDLGEHILHKKLVIEVAEFEEAASKMLAEAYKEYNISQEMVSFGLIRPDKLAKERGIWLVPYEIQVPSGQADAYRLKDYIMSSLQDTAHMEGMAKNDDLNNVLKPEDSEMERIVKMLKKQKKAEKSNKTEEGEGEEEHFQVPVSAIMKKAKGGTQIVDPGCTVVDDPCTFKVAKGIDTVLVAMSSHTENVDVQHCGVHLLRWILAWGDADVAKIMTEAKAEDEIQAAMKKHPNHRSLNTHAKFALRRLAFLNSEAGNSTS